MLTAPSSRATNRHWERLLQVIGREDLLGDPRFADPVIRYTYHKEIDEIVSAWTRQHDKRTVMKLLGEAGVAVGAVFDTKDLSEDPYLRERGVFVTLKHPKHGEFAMPTLPVKMSRSQVPVVLAPALGAHSDEVYRELLGRQPAELAALHEEKAI